MFTNPDPSVQENTPTLRPLIVSNPGDKERSGEAGQDLDNDND